MNTLMNVSNRTNKRILNELNDMVGLAARKNVKIFVAGDPTFKKCIADSLGPALPLRCILEDYQWGINHVKT